MSIVRIISGGQTGADRGGLDAALNCNIPHSGWCPKGRKAEDGEIPAQYCLTPTPSGEYSARTAVNVVDSDATVIFSRGRLAGGSAETAEFCRKYRRPWLHVDLAMLDRKKAAQAILKWLKRDCPKKCVLNVAGARESGAPGIRQAVMNTMLDVLAQTNPHSR